MVASEDESVDVDLGVDGLVERAWGAGVGD
jgi:hypothetical protein